VSVVLGSKQTDLLSESRIVWRGGAVHGMVRRHYFLLHSFRGYCLIECGKECRLTLTNSPIGDLFKGGPLNHET
jgi:hypothetical protein